MDDELKDNHCSPVFICRGWKINECAFFIPHHIKKSRCKYLCSDYSCLSKVATVNAATLYIKQQTEGSK